MKFLNFIYVHFWEGNYVCVISKPFLNHIEGKRPFSAVLATIKFACS